ncbi:elongation factor 1-delta isoform X1 [Oncorhynchus kisutch]|uniref:elongation factor 1-delta isoform X1 n=1 Tax=Oncorhynchus kisutch TaxID=8019 RepID=UPI0012DDB32E|nr:elongation factor 1-delta isoform X1 [Oncorhynchus kisutch]
MSGLQCLGEDNIWFEKPRYDEAERRFYEGANGPSTHSHHQVKSALQGRGRSRPQKRQHRNSSSASGDQELVSRMKSLELENQGLHKVVEDLRAALFKLENRVRVLERSPAVPCAKVGLEKSNLHCPLGLFKQENRVRVLERSPAVPCAKAVTVQSVKVEEEDDDEMDLFGSDEEDEEAERLKEERIAAYAAKKSKKPALIAKSSILLDVKPWDDETDMSKLEECVRSVVADGLLWGQSKLVPVGYGIKKLQIGCVVEDDKVGTDLLEEEITKFEDYVQSVDVAAFNKI